MLVANRDAEASSSQQLQTEIQSRDQPISAALQQLEQRAAAAIVAQFIMGHPYKFSVALKEREQVAAAAQASHNNRQPVSLPHGRAPS